MKKKNAPKKSKKAAAAKKSPRVSRQGLSRPNIIREGTKKTPSKKTAEPKARAIPQHAGYEKVLIKKRDEITRTVKNKEADITLGEVGDELDQASQTFEREMIFELTNGERAILDDIEAALRKMEKGDFGTCEICRGKIGSPRLHAMPWARYCIGCQSKAEGSPR